MKRIGTAVLLAGVLAGCGGEGDADEPAFNEDAVVEALRDGWPNTPEEELRSNQAQTFREACTSDLNDAANETAFALQLRDPISRGILEAGCPDRVAEFDD